MEEPKSNKNLWYLVIALLAVVIIIFVLNPTRGEDEAQMEAAVEQAEIDRDDTLQDYPVQADPVGEEGEIELEIPEGEETGDLDPQSDAVSVE